MSEHQAQTGRNPQLDAISKLLLQREVEAFLYNEAATIDGRRFEDWLKLFSEDVRYWIPIRKNLPFKYRFEDMGNDHDIAWVDDTKTMMRARVAQIMTGVHWAEEPLSRVSHLVTNVTIDSGFCDSSGEEMKVHSRILVHRARMDSETTILIGRREDRLRRAKDTFETYYRKIILDQTTLPAKNLSFFL